MLADGGMFSCNGYEVSPEHFYWKAVFEELKLSSSFISKVIDTKIEKQEQFKRLLEEYFSRVDSVQLDNMMQYDNSDDLFNRLLEHYPEEKKYIMTNEGKIKEYLDAKQIAVTVKRGIEDVLIVV